MMNWFAVCIFAFVTLCPDAYANIGDDMAITVKICCNEGHQFAQEHDSCDELLCEPPKSSLVLTLMCSMAQQECCTDYIQKKTECEEGIYTSISIYNCASRKNTRQVCCQECIRGTSLGASKGPTACQKQPKGTTAEDILSNDAFVKCCEIAAEDWKDTTSQRNSKDVTTSTLPSMCEKNAPNKLCAHHCIPIPGSYKCECNRGFMLMDDGRNCMEVTKNSCNNCQHKCNDNGVEVKCYCNQGYELMPDEKSCQDIDECQLEKTKCPLDAKCHNFLGSYACIPVNKNVDYNNRGHQCPSGYIWINENNACEDIDECALGTYHCGANYSCYNMKGTYRCDQPAIIVIKQFFDFKAENETSSNKSPKEITTTSTSKPNGGVSRNSSSVRTLEEEASNKNVGNNAEPSEETPKPHKPLPRLPPSGSTDPKVLATEPSRTEGVLPQDTESAPTQSPTDLHSRVTTIKPSPKPPVDANNSTIFNEKDKTSKNSTNPRDCLAGFALDEYGACFDIDECATNNHTCSALTETCINTPGGFTCNCTTGFERDSITKSCIDSNECETEEAKCGPLQICTNLAGSYTCSCPSGYKLIADRECEDIDECETGEANCGPQQICTNMAGGYKCTCPSGYKLMADHECEDINECEIETEYLHLYICYGSLQASNKCMASRAGSLCQHRCKNVWGGYRCSCHRGYRLKNDNRTCSDIDECDEFKSKFLCISQCVNEVGSYHCTCPSGYTLSPDKKSCIDIDECATGEALCSNATASSTSNLICINVRGSYKCHRISCPAGYKLENQHRCTKVKKTCPLSDWTCQHQPTTISYNFITFVSNLYIPESQISEGRSEKKAQNKEFGPTVGPLASPTAQASSDPPQECPLPLAPLPLSSTVAPSLPPQLDSAVGHAVDKNESGTVVPKQKSMAEIARQRQWKTQAPSERWVRVQNKRLRKRGIAIPEPGSNFIVAETKIPMYIYNVAKNVSVCGISSNIMKKANRCTKVKKTCPLSDWTCQHQPTTISYNFITFVSNLYIPESQPMCYLGMASYVCCRNGGALRCWLAGYGCTQSYSECPAPLGYPPGPTTYFSLKLFTMRLPTWPNAKSSFQLRLVNVSGPPSVRNKADIYNFLITVPIQSEAVLSLIRPLEGPQTIELEISMEVYTDEQYGGTAVAKVFIYVSEYEF